MISITQTQVEKALGDFLTRVLAFPLGQVVTGQVNRVPEPEGDFCEMWPLSRPRLATNVETPEDVKFTGSINGLAMNVSAVAHGVIAEGNVVFGEDVEFGTKIAAQVDGTPGGIGNYTVTLTNELTSQVLSAGVINEDMSTEVVMQVDVHGPSSTDNAQIIQQLLRSPYGVRLFEGTGVSPLYADNPKQMPFHNAANQYEDRWVVDVHLQIHPVIPVPQEFADSLVVGITNVPAQLTEV